MWLTSNRPARVRTAMCSSVLPEYSTGISQPAYGTMRAPDARCRACKGVVRRLAAAVSVMEQNETRQDSTTMTVLAARREGQGTEMSGRRAQQHRATAEAIEDTDQM